jgi:DNA-binding response OmpR family regulator
MLELDASSELETPEPRSSQEKFFANLKPWGGVGRPSRADLRGVRVLVVEDHWLVANALKAFLEAEGMEVSGPAATTADARRLAMEQKPDVAVVDIHLWLETAYVLIHQLDEQGVCVVVLSGYSVLPALTTEVVAVLQKPFKGPELLGALRRALAR